MMSRARSSTETTAQDELSQRSTVCELNILKTHSWDYLNQSIFHQAPVAEAFRAFEKVMELANITFPSSFIPELGNYSFSENGSFLDGLPFPLLAVPKDIAGEIRIPLYCFIFVLAVTGNTLVIITLVQNRRMRTVTNVFLLNLAISDLLLAVFCMPFTLIPVLLKNFIFGPIMCVFIRYLQAVSVGVSVFTLVAMSLERYFAICQPLSSRQWQTLSHAYKTIAACWIISLFIMVPIAAYTRLLQLSPGRFACRETWDNTDLERAYTVLLDVILLLLPLTMMCLCYGAIMRTLWRGMRSQRRNGPANRDGKSL